MKDSPNLGSNKTTTKGQTHGPEGTSHSVPSQPDVVAVAYKHGSLIAAETLDQIEASASVVEAPAQTQPAAARSTGKSAFLVGAGILISRIVGLVRQRIFAHYFGSSGEGDAFSAAFKIPNFLQNVFGEGALSASFIPVYAKLLAQGDEKEATKAANAIFGLLALVTSLIVLIGVLATPYFVAIIAGGFQDERRELTIKLVRTFFPGAG